MKYTFAFLLLGTSALVDAQPIHRCVDHQGQLSFQSNPCPNIEVGLASLGSGDRNMSWDRREQISTDAHAERQRVQSVLQEDDARMGDIDANNQRRCLSALRAAKMCGRFAGMFSCGKHGFQHEEPSAKSSVDLLHAVKGGRETVMQQCLQQVAE